MSTDANTDVSTDSLKLYRNSAEKHGSMVCIMHPTTLKWLTTEGAWEIPPMSIDGVRLFVDIDIPVGEFRWF